MRGKVVTRDDEETVMRITPAYAGKRIQYQAGSMGLKDHPRLCGEKEKRFKFKMTLLGSPPPMRGKGSIFRFPSDGDRITPAYAGKSFKVSTGGLFS